MEILSAIKNDKKINIVVILFVFVLFLFVIGGSFAAFTDNNNKLIANISVNNLIFNITTNNGDSDDRILHLKPGKMEEFDVILTNLNNISAKYDLIYKVCIDIQCNSFYNNIPDDIEIYKSTETPDDLNGTIRNGNEFKKSIALVTVNKTEQDYYIKLDLNAGYEWNDLELTNLEIDEMEGLLPGIEVLAYVDGNPVSVQSIPNTCNYVASIQAYVDGALVNGNSLFIDCDRNTNKWRIYLDGLDTIPNKMIMNFEVLAYPSITYTGDYQFIEDDDLNWRIKFLSSGTLTFDSLGNAVSGIDVFCVGGGGGAYGGYQGGSDGGDGFGYYAGKGQGTTTREFGEPTGQLYAGGGGSTSAAGGAGGGAQGSTSAAANTGGGAGGTYDNNTKSYSGGSGIVVIRNARG